MKQWLSVFRVTDAAAFGMLINAERVPLEKLQFHRVSVGRLRERYLGRTRSLRSAEIHHLWLPLNAQSLRQSCPRAI